MAKLYELIYQGEYSSIVNMKNIAAATFLQAHEKAQKITKKLYNVRILSIVEKLDQVEIA